MILQALLSGHLKSFFFLWILFAKLDDVEAFTHRTSCRDLDPKDRPRFNCTQEGLSFCADGWKGKDCDIALCKKGCHSTHGFCNEPGQCKCQPGWRGETCEECVPLPGCQHGYCRRNSYECICEPGWKGTYCSIPICRRGCRPSRGYCSLPHECKCRIGWKGSTCEQCETLPGCLHGHCGKPLECLCDPGWTGQYCEKPVCSSNCHADHGSCNEPNECRCAVGWWGENCDTCFPYPGCKHGTCNEPWECNCDPGWKGLRCDEEDKTTRIYCDLHPNTCLNGGTCIDVPNERNYTCSCLSLFTGRHCDYLVRSSAPFFPIFRKGTHTWRSQSSLHKEDFMKPTTLARLSTEPESAPRRGSILDMQRERKKLSPKDSAELLQQSSKAIAERPAEDSSEGIPEKEADPKEIETGGKPSPEAAKPFKNFTEGSSDGERKVNPPPISGSPPEKDKPVGPPSTEASFEAILGAAKENAKALNVSKTIIKRPTILLDLKERIKEKVSESKAALKDTDPNSPQANQIDQRARFLRHQESVGIPPPPNLQESSPSPSFYKSVRVGSQEPLLSLSNLKTEHFAVQRPPFTINSLPLQTEKKLPRITQARIDRRTGLLSPKEKMPRRVFKIFPGENKRDSILRASSSFPSFSVSPKQLGRLAPTADGESRARAEGPTGPTTIIGVSTSFSSSSSRSNKKGPSAPELTPRRPTHEIGPAAVVATEKTPDQGVSASEGIQKTHDPTPSVDGTLTTFYDEHYNGRVHIGDVTEVDKDVPLQAIMDAFIELKKLKS